MSYTKIVRFKDNTYAVEDAIKWSSVLSEGEIKAYMVWHLQIPRKVVDACITVLKSFHRENNSMAQFNGDYLVSIDKIEETKQC